MTSKPFVSRTLATLRIAEFGFLGVVVYTRVHTPRFCGHSCKCIDFDLFTFGCRGLRISCWMVCIPVIPRSLLLSVCKSNFCNFCSCTLLSDNANYHMHSYVGGKCSDISEDRGVARIVTILILRTPKVTLWRDSERIGGVDLLVNSRSLAIYVLEFHWLTLKGNIIIWS